MRAFVVVFLGLAVSTSAAEAHRHPHAGGHKATRAAMASHHPTRVVAVESLPRGPVTGQSVGAPWSGRLREPAQLPEGDGYVIRRPWRSFGTSTTVSHVERVVDEWRQQFPDAHVLAIGDISAEHGGTITDHHSHQSGRDIDVGLIYKQKPASYPASFIDATADNLDCEATFALLESFAATAKDDGGAQIVFLDYNVQGLLYKWAKDNEFDDALLNRLFQYPHGRSSSEGLVRHFPNHANHFHVRFRCANADDYCR